MALIVNNKFIVVMILTKSTMLLNDACFLSKKVYMYISISFQQFPYPKFTQNFFIQTIQGLLPLLMTLAFMYSAVMVIKVSIITSE